MLVISYVAAAGNDMHNIDLYETYPASFNEPNGIVVAAAASYNAVRAWMSNYGFNTVDILLLPNRIQQCLNTIIQHKGMPPHEVALTM